MAAIDGPVDLVGHDWGGGLVNRLVSTRPELVRTWVTDVAGLAHADFEWHDIAKLWQTPGDGEAFFEAQLAMSLDDRTALLERRRHPRAGACGAWPRRSTRRWPTASWRCTARPSTSARSGAPTSRTSRSRAWPVAPEDGLANPERTEAAAARAGRTVHRLDGLAHWWLLEDPTRGARMLEDFWSSVD